MRAAATVVRLMPSPTNRITFFARPAMAPRCAACAAPSRNHQAGVSPPGRWIGGTSTAIAGVREPPAVGAGVPVVAQAPTRVVARARARMRDGGMGIGDVEARVRGGDYAAWVLRKWNAGI